MTLFPRLAELPFAFPLRGQSARRGPEGRGVREEDILPAVRRSFRRWQRASERTNARASGDLRGRKKDSGILGEESTRRERGRRDKKRRKRGSRGAFLRDVAFAGHHAYVTLREGHVRAYNTIRGVIPPRVLSRTPLQPRRRSPRRRRPRCRELCSPLPASTRRVAG